MKNKAIFLDRDGTLIHEVNFLSTVEETRLFDFSIEALSLLRDSGFKFFITTNQSGIARGLFDESAVNAIHLHINEILNQAGLNIEKFEFCRHFPDEGCSCRKPNPGMIERAVDGMDIDLSESWVIGDKKLDIEMGMNAGTKCALVRTGYGEKHQETLDRKPDLIVENLLEAARKITEN